MLAHAERGLLFLRPPRTASRAVAQFLRPLGFEDIASHHETQIPDGYGDYQVVVPVRNHFDALVSWYYGFMDTHAGFGHPFGPAWLDELIRQSTLLEPNELWGPWLRAAPWCRIIRYEQLAGELEQLLPDVTAPLPRVGFTAGRPALRDAYTDEMREHVAERYAHELEQLGYGWGEL